MNNNLKFEIARDVITQMIAYATKDGFNPEEPITARLLQEEEQVNQFNEEVIERVIEDYLPFIKNGGLHE